ncbi:hypothetical protein ACXIZN_04825 [Amycolatopsis sp. TRM77291]
MSTLVRYIRAGEGRLFDLAKLCPEGLTLIEDLRGAIDRGDRVLLCRQAPDDDDGAEMFVRLRGGRFWAVHFPGGSCKEQHAIGGEPDEHRRQKEYWQRAAEDAGYRVLSRAPDRTRHGARCRDRRPVPDRDRCSALGDEPSLVKTGTTKSFGAGWLPVWFLDSDGTPPWFSAVPSLRCDNVPWSTVQEQGPRPRSVLGRWSGRNARSAPSTDDARWGAGADVLARRGRAGSGIRNRRYVAG